MATAATAPLAVVSVAWAVILAAGGCASQESALNRETYETRKSLTRELIVRGQWPSAFSYADSLHRERPRDAEVLVLRGTIYRERGMWTEAEADLLAAVQLDGRSAEAHAALGILYDLTLRPDAAEPQHREAIKLAPNSVAFLNNLGFCLFLRGKIRDAITYYEQAARLEPTSQRVRTNLGFAFAASGDLRRAAHEFEMGGTPAEAKNNLGFAYERRGDFTHAYDLYLEAAELDPQSTRARSNLVHAAHELGRPLPAAARPVSVEVVGAPAPAAASAPTFGPPAPMAPPPASSSSSSSSPSSAAPSAVRPATLQPGSEAMIVVLRQRCVSPRARIALAAVMVGLGWGGCSRAHLTPTFGRAYHEVFAIQDANPNRQGSGKSVHGLDSQEAAIIAGSYRKALAGKSDTGNNTSGQLLMMSPNRGGGDATLAPSVPPGN